MHSDGTVASAETMTIRQIDNILFAAHLRTQTCRNATKRTLEIMPVQLSSMIPELRYLIVKRVDLSSTGICATKEPKLFLLAKMPVPRTGYNAILLYSSDQEITVPIDIYNTIETKR